MSEERKMPFRAQIVERNVAELKPYPRNARTHSRKQIKQIAASIERFGFTNPILVSGTNEIIACHTLTANARFPRFLTVCSCCSARLEIAPMLLSAAAENSSPDIILAVSVVD